MMREIRKKMVILRNRSPFPQEVKAYLYDLEYREWISMNMRLSGSSLSMEQIDTILRGGCIMEATVSAHLMLDRLEELRQFIYRLTDLGAPLSETIVRDMHAILVGKNEREDYRKSTPVLREYDCMAMTADLIPDAMVQLMRFAGQGTDSAAGSLYNPLERAVLVHNRLLEIYPFREENEMVARAAMYYMVAEAGLPMAAVKLDAEEYRQDFLRYRSKTSDLCLAKHLAQAVVDRLELMIQLTRYEI